MLKTWMMKIILIMQINNNLSQLSKAQESSINLTRGRVLANLPPPSFLNLLNGRPTLSWSPRKQVNFQARIDILLRREAHQPNFNHQTDFTTLWTCQRSWKWEMFRIRLNLQAPHLKILLTRLKITLKLWTRNPLNLRSRWDIKSTIRSKKKPNHSNSSTMGQRRPPTNTWETTTKSNACKRQ